MTNNTPLKVLAAICLLLILTLGMAIGATWQRAEFNAYFETLPQCQTEDSVNCYWDGGSNAEGFKFIDLNGEVHVLP